MENDGRGDTEPAVSEVSRVGNAQDLSGIVFDADPVFAGSHVPIGAFNAVFRTFVVAFFAGFVTVETAETSVKVMAELVGFTFGTEFTFIDVLKYNPPKGSQMWLQWFELDFYGLCKIEPNVPGILVQHA